MTEKLDQILEEIEEIKDSKERSSVNRLINLLDSNYWIVKNKISAILIQRAKEQKDEIVIDLLIEGLRSGNEEIRFWGIRILGEARAEKAQDVLKEYFLSCTQAKMKIFSAESLAKLHDRDGIRFLFQEMASTSYTCREQAANSIKKMNEVLAPYVIKFLQSENEDIRYWCDFILSDLKLESPEILIQVLKHPQENVRNSSVKALRNYSEPQIIEILTEMFNDKSLIVRETACESLIFLGEECVNHLVGKLQGTDQEEIIRLCIKSLCNLGEKVFIFVKGLMVSKNIYKRLYSAKYAYMLKNFYLADDLIALLRDKQLSVRKAAAESLTQLGDGVVDILQRYLHEENEDLCYWLYYVLGRLKGRSVKLILDSFNSEENYRRLWATKALAETSIPSMVGEFVLKLSDPYWPIREAASVGLEKIGHERSVLETLIRNVKNENPDISFWIMRILSNIREKIISQLIEIMKMGNQDMKFYTANALGQLLDKRAIPVLVDSLGDGNDWVRELSLNALIKMDAFEELEKVVFKVEGEMKVRISKELMKLGRFDLNPFFDRLGSPNLDEKEKAYNYLMAFGDQILSTLQDRVETEENEDIRMGMMKLMRSLTSRGNEFI